MGIEQAIKTLGIDPATETLVPFSAAGGAFPGERTPSRATLHRWRLRGVRGVKLETILIGGLRYTSKEAIERFIVNQNSADAPSAAMTPAQRRTQSEAARQALAEAGI